jgi:tetratricopeptide (TPR) repeat protein
MARRAEKIGKWRPWIIDQLPASPDCLPILQELESDLGLELMMLAHQVLLRAGPTPAPESGTGDSPVLRSAAEITSHVKERREYAMGEAPADLIPELRTLWDVAARPLSELAAACGYVSEWARGAGYPITATVFAEAGATVAPDDPHAAFLAGRANRLTQQFWRAEVFYRRAIRLAYRELNWDVYIRSLLGLGKLMSESGRADVAEEFYSTAASVAETEGLKWLAAQTYHDMLVLHFDSGDLDRALDYARRALRTYPAHNERLPIFVHDVAFVLIAGCHFDDAFPILRAVFKAPLDPQEQVLVAGTMARAAGSLRLEEDLAEAEARLLAHAPHHTYHAAFSMLNLAHGMRAIGDWRRAEQYAARALVLADETDVDYVRVHGAALREEIRMRVPAPPAASAPVDRQLAEDLRALAPRVEGWHNAPGWKARWGSIEPKRVGTV